MILSNPLIELEKQSIRFSRTVDYSK